MQDNNKAQFKEMLTASWGLYGKTLTPQMLTLFWESLKKYEISEISGAISRHTVNPDTGQFAPKPADIVKYIEGSSDDMSLKAWSKVEETIRRKGVYVEGLVFDDPIIHAVLKDMGGWVQMCATPTEQDLHFQSIEFCKRYKGFMYRGNFEYPAKLKGLVADGEPVLMIGSQEKASQVLIGGSEVTLQMTHVEDLVKLTKEDD